MDSPTRLPGNNLQPLGLHTVAAILAAILFFPGCSDGEPAPQDTEDVRLRILTINDFHGHIDTSSDSFGGVGRADHLAANIAAARAEVDSSAFVSALFHDEPTIKAMNLMSLDINAVGNHEFDEGPDELLRMQFGGSHPVDGDIDGDPFEGADFQFLAANVIDDATGEPILPTHVVREYGGIGVAFIGMTLEGTPGIVARSSVAGLTFLDEADTVNELVPILREEGIEAIVVLLHQGGFADGGRNDCGSGLAGPLAGVVGRMDNTVDLVIAGHTNDEFACEIDGKWVTIADNRGRLFTVIDATLDRQTGDLMVRSIENRPNSQEGVSPSSAVTALIDWYDTLSATRGQRGGRLHHLRHRPQHERGRRVGPRRHPSRRPPGGDTRRRRRGGPHELRGDQGGPAVRRLGE